MENKFADDEQLYRAVYPPDHPGMFWREDGTLSPAAFADPKGLSVERGYHRTDTEVVGEMKDSFTGRIVSVSAGQCRDCDVSVKYMPTKRSNYHTEIHDSDDVILITKSKRVKLAKHARLVYAEDINIVPDKSNDNS